MKRIKKYIPFIRANIIQTFIYRGTIWLWLIVDVFQFVMMVFLWKSVYQYQTSISGFTFHDMLIYFLLTNLFYIFTQVEAVFMMAEEIREGRISLYMIKPISYKTRLFSEMLGRVAGLFILLIPVVLLTGLVVISVFNITWQVSWIQVLQASLYVPLIFMLIFEFSFMFGIVTIYTTNDFGLVIFMSVLIRMVSGQIIPLALYPAFLQNILNYLPFRFISYPPLILLNQVDLNTAWMGLLVMALWVIGFKGVNYVLFKLSVKKMVVFGG